MPLGLRARIDSQNLDSSGLFVGSELQSQRTSLTKRH